MVAIVFPASQKPEKINRLILSAIVFELLIGLFRTDRVNCSWGAALL